MATEYTYDAAGRKLTERNPAGEVTQLSYDLRGNVIASQQPIGQVSRSAFDAQGHQIAAQDANGALGTLLYDNFGKLQSYTDIGGAFHAMSYDNAGQLIEHQSTRSQNIIYGYDDAGQLTGIDDIGVGRQTQYSYDVAGHQEGRRVKSFNIRSNPPASPKAMVRKAMVLSLQATNLQLPQQKIQMPFHARAGVLHTNCAIDSVVN